MEKEREQAIFIKQRSLQSSSSSRADGIITLPPLEEQQGRGETELVAPDASISSRPNGGGASQRKNLSNCKGKLKPFKLFKIQEAQKQGGQLRWHVSPNTPQLHQLVACKTGADLGGPFYHRNHIRQKEVIPPSC
jgi:hypothetical protein